MKTSSSLKADSYLVQFGKRAEFRNRYLSCLMKFVLPDNTHFKTKQSHKSARSLNHSEWKTGLKISSIHHLDVILHYVNSKCWFQEPYIKHYEPPSHRNFHISALRYEAKMKWWYISKSIIIIKNFKNTSSESTFSNIINEYFARVNATFNRVRSARNLQRVHLYILIYLTTKDIQQEAYD